MSAPRPVERPAVAPVAVRHRWVSTPVSTPPDATREQLGGLRIACLGGRPPLADAVRRAAETLGASVVPVAVRGATDAGSWPTLPASLREPVDHVIDLGADEVVRPASGTDASAWWPALSRTWAVLRALQPSWAAHPAADSTTYLAVTRTGGHAGTRPGPVPGPCGGLWAGLAKGLPHEFPTTRVRVLDLEEGDPGAEAVAILRELVTPGPIEIGYAGGVRHHLRATPAPLPRSSWDLGPDHLVLVTGGGRGIGWAVSEHLARSTGCTVVVTGRDDLLPADDPWLDPAQVPALRADALRRAAAHGDLAQGRRHARRMLQRAEVTARIAAAEREGVPVRFERADVTRPGDVCALLRRLPGSPDVVIHNAGVDQPGRLKDKHPDTVLTTVSVKVDGFAVLSAELRRAGVLPRVWCNVGSMTGRWGGLLGQLEYGAANEALSRLGQWAEHDPDAPATATTTLTVAWPTWERLGGLISNFDEAVRHMGAMPVAEGLDHWRSELLAAEGGEVGYLPPLTTALPPALLRGYQQPQLAVAERLGTLSLLVSDGYLVDHQEVGVRLVVDPAQWPVVRDVTWRGSPMLPASLALDLAATASGWHRALPAGRADLRQIRLRPAALVLRAHPSSVEITSRALVAGAAPGGGPDTHTCVELRVDGQLALTLSVAGPPDSTVVDQPVLTGGTDAAGELAPPGPGAGDTGPLEMHGVVLPTPRWSLDGGVWDAWVAEADPRSLTLVEPPPRPILPLCALEAVIHRLLGAASSAAGPRSVLAVPALCFTPWEPDPAQGRTRPHRLQATSRSARVLDPSGRVVLTLEDAVLIADHPPRTDGGEP